MLFNSIEFIFAFLPVTLLGYFLLAQRSTECALAWLAAASLVFYAGWDPRYLILLVASVTFNFLIGQKIAATRPSRHWLVIGITINLGLLGYYKYANFFLDNLALATGHDFSISRIALPLGISFFTFTQIAYLIDASRGIATEYRFSKYLLFATFFPHLIAGPIWHHKEIMPQLESPQIFRPDWDCIATGLAFFSIGLAKKVILADGIAPFGTDIFDAANREVVTFFEAWQGALAYTLQLYFDFSGYCDMAIGCALLFGIRIPVNFASPYKAKSIIEFWRTWHITLSRFLRDYLYIPLGGNRLGGPRRYLNLMLVMILGGLWHGAGWTFVIWGALHGAYLLINHAWRALGPPDRPCHALAAAGYWTLTFLSIVFAWVFFRADNVDAALNMARGLSGLNGFELEASHRGYFGPLAPLLESAGIVFAPSTAIRLSAAPWIACLLGICLLLPNSQAWLWGQGGTGTRHGLLPLNWRPTAVCGLLFGALASYAIGLIGRPSEFLYFNF